jgi:hypothetical protein
MQGALRDGMRVTDLAEEHLLAPHGADDITTLIERKLGRLLTTYEP